MSTTSSIKRISTSDPCYSNVLQLRNDVLRKPIGLSLFDEDLTLEEHDVIFVDKEESEAENVNGCVYLRLHSDEKLKWYALRQMAVAPSQRGKNVGRQL